MAPSSASLGEAILATPKHAPLEVFHAHKFLIDQMADVWPCVLRKFVRDEVALKQAAEKRAAEIRARCSVEL